MKSIKCANVHYCALCSALDRQTDRQTEGGPMPLLLLLLLLVLLILLPLVCSTPFCLAVEIKRKRKVCFFGSLSLTSVDFFALVFFSLLLVATDGVGVGFGVKLIWPLCASPSHKLLHTPTPPHTHTHIQSASHTAVDALL